MGRSGSEWRSSLVGRAPGAPALAGAGEPRAPFGIPDQRGRGTRRVVPGWFLDEEIEGSKFGSRKNILIFQAIIGAPAEIRTPDPQIRGWQSDADPVQVWVGKSSCRNSASATPCFPALRLACWRGAQGQGCHPNGGNGLSFVGAAAVITGSGCHVRRGRSEGTQAKRRSRSDSAAP